MQLPRPFSGIHVHIPPAPLLAQSVIIIRLSRSVGVGSHLYRTSPSLYHTNRAISQNWTGVQQYGQLFMLAVQRSHAS